MTIGQIECFAGISGDMLLGALIDAGVPAELLQNAAAALGIEDDDFLVVRGET